MNPLLYSSNEMFSSTELIRKSKMIFDKLLSSEVEKAIILRDGKPGFMLLEFSKYEELMKEYMALKEQTANNDVEKPILKEDDTDVLADMLNEEIVEEEEIVEPKITIEETPEEQFEHIEDDISEDDLQKALADIESLGLEEDVNASNDISDELDEDDELDELANSKKEQPLKEFWD